MASNLPNTRPTRSSLNSERTRPSSAVPRQANPPTKGSDWPNPRSGRLRRFVRSPLIVALFTLLVALFLVSAASGAVGWSAGRGQYYATATFEAGLYMLDQYNLAVTDMEAGNYNLARQRLEFIFAQDPEFLDVADLWIEVMLALGGTSQPTNAGLGAPSPTPTQDPRPKEELLAAAQSLLIARDWTKAIDTLLALRKSDITFHTADVDGMLYAALRNRGMQNIIELGLFEPGLYDFALAEKFGPLDNEANILRDGARYYLYGNAFWLAYPQDAAYYFGLSMSIAPGLIDSNGLSAFYRYWMSLVHYGDQLAAEGDWCGAVDAYQDAINARADTEVQGKLNTAQFECLGPTDVPSTDTPIPNSTSTPTYTGVAPTATDTSAAPTDTPIPSNTPLPSNTPVPSDTSAPTETPSETSTP